MSNVIALPAKRKKRKLKLDDNDIFFPVREDIIEVPGNADTSRFKAVVREDTNEVLAIHSNDYKLVTNEEMFGPLHDTIAEVLDTTGMYIDDQIGDGGRRVSRTYHLPAHTVDIGTALKPDPVELQIKALNSYDGSWAFKKFVGGWRALCTNGMVIGDILLSLCSRHTAGLDPEFSAERVSGALGVYMEQTKIWKRWRRVKINDEQAKRAIAKMGSKPSPKIQKAVFEQWLLEKEQLGSTMWGLYNAMTYWSSHTEARSKADPVNALQAREERVKSAIRSQPFLKLVA